MKTLPLASLLLFAMIGGANAGFSSDGIPQFPKAGGCNAFWMPGPNGGVSGLGTTVSPQGQWYAISSTDGSPTTPGYDYNRGGRWAQVLAAWSTGKALWVTSPSTVDIPPSLFPETVQCNVPTGGGQLPNAIIYANPEKPGD